LETTREHIIEEKVEERPPIPPPPDISSWQMIMVEVSSLFMDRRYQRGLVKTQVKKLVNGWDWEKYHPISISHRVDGRYAVIAGQQRTTAALELGIEKLPAVLRLSQDIHSEAKQYLGSGEQAPIQSSDRFKARLMANEQKAFDIWNTVEKCGFSLRCMRVEEPGGWVDPMAIEAVHAVESVFDAGYLEKTLYVIRTTWGSEPHKNMVQGTMIRGMYLAIRHLKFNGIEHTELAERLQKNIIPAKEVINKGYDRYRSMVHSRSIDAGIAGILIDQFNFRRRELVPEYSPAAIRAEVARKARKAYEKKYGANASPTTHKKTNNLPPPVTEE